MAELADAVVVGGGVMGTSIALHLAQSGAGRVVLLEKRHIAAGASGKSGAMIGSHFGHELKIRMALESMRTWLNFDQAVGGRNVYKRCGRVWAVSEIDAASLRQICALQREFGSTARLLEPADLGELVPQATLDGIAAAVYEEDAGYADPVAATYAYAEAARRAGAEVREQTPVRRLLVERGLVRGVAGEWGQIETGVVVLANNAWVGQLARTAGIELPIEPQRSEIGLFRRPVDFGEHPAFADFPQGAYYRPDAGGVTFVGRMEPAAATTVTDPDDFEEMASWATVQSYRGRLGRRFARLEASVFRGAYAGLYDTSPDFYPVLDRVGDLEGLFCAVGFSGDGFKYAPVVGSWMSRLVLEGRLPADGALRLSRFADGRPLRATFPFTSSAWFR